MVKHLNEINGFDCSNSQGAFYLFPSIKKTGLKSNDMENILLNKLGIAAVSGNSFGAFGEGYIRLSYASSDENIKKNVSLKFTVYFNPLLKLKVCQERQI